MPNLGVWPNNDTTIHAVLSGANGSELFRDTLGMLQPSSPVLLDFNEDTHLDIVSQVNRLVRTPLTKNFQSQLIIYDGKTGSKSAIDSLVYGQNLVHQALNPDPHKLVLFLLLGVGKILIMLRHNSGFPALIRRKITLSMGFIT